MRTSTSRSVLANAKAQLLMALQDEDVGAVLGKKGQTLTQIQQVRSSGLNQGWAGARERQLVGSKAVQRREAGSEPSAGY